MLVLSLILILSLCDFCPQLFSFLKTIIQYGTAAIIIEIKRRDESIENEREREGVGGNEHKRNKSELGHYFLSILLAFNSNFMLLFLGFCSG